MTYEEKLVMLEGEEELAWFGVNGGDSDEYTIRMLEIIIDCQRVRAGLRIENELKQS